ncbi:MAG: hypothetical protein FWE35_16950 [Streptosporangiales bacterium]|nr:hypothetical protein [Streptosporangiales bacterium]
MSPFGNGLSAAIMLRERILGCLGAKTDAEAEWTRETENLELVAWMSGPVATFFRVGEGAAHTPDLGVLRVVTPVTVIDDLDAALETCDRLNQAATLSRWTVEDDGMGTRALAIGCVFVVGPHNADTLEDFALWCVREQISVATARADGILTAWIDGGPGPAPEANTELYGWGPYPGMELRPDGSAHEVTRYCERHVAPARDAFSDPLADALTEAFCELRREMRAEGLGEWGNWKTAPVLTFETPMAWGPYPGGSIARKEADDTQTALVVATLDDHPCAGNGLRLSVRIPWGPVKEARSALAEMNHLDLQVAGSTHGIGGWHLGPCPTEEDPDGQEYLYTVYLPAALADPSLGLDLPLVMREVLLTVARQALLFRRLLHPDLRDAEDENSSVGLAATCRHGLAWGETGEGRDPAAEMLNRLYERFTGDDPEWADTSPGGFTWWPYEQSQTITVTPAGGTGPDASPVLRIATEVRAGVSRTPGTLDLIARLNAELGRSVLRLAPGGRLILECHLTLDDESGWFRRWAEYLAVDQYSTARDLLGRLDGTGTPAVSVHPFAGPRPDDGELLGLRDALYVPLARGALRGLTPVAPLLATAGQVILPYRIAARDDGGLDFTWHPSQADVSLPVDPAVRVSVRPGDTGAGPGWIVRSHVPVAGTPEAKARWCAAQNDALLDTPALYVTGGWGLSPGGECCLTTWLPPFLLTEQTSRIRFLTDAYRDHQAAVLASLADGSLPGAPVAEEPLHPADLAEGLRQTLGTFAAILDYPAGHQWTVETREAGVVATAGGTVLQIPATCDRSELGLLYARFLGASETRVHTRHAYDLVPGELEDWSFSWQQVNDVIGRLNADGVIDWPENETSGFFEVGGARGTLTVRYLESDRLYGASSLMIAATVPGGGALPEGEAPDIDVLGAWHHRDDGPSYEVTLPPAGLVWAADRDAAAILLWVARHVIRHVRAALQQPTQNS